MKHLLALLFLLPFAPSSSLSAADTLYAPAWAKITPKRSFRHTNPKPESLVKTIADLKPGDELVIAAGTYSVGPMWDLRISGTAEAPIWITADDDSVVIFTRADVKQNVLNIGQGEPVQYVCLRGIELTGGSHGLRLGQCSHVWIDRCHIHHTGGVCLSANSADTDHLFLTNNHIHHGSGHAEGMYLGANNGDHIMSESVIARNHVHDCYGDQGDGIEVKQGSWGNLIAENDVHDTNYPCITVYGTAGKPVNVIERNLCRRSADNAMQVQGEAIVRNNVLIGAKGSAFTSTDHQGKTLNLQVVHNTIINMGRAFSGGSWNDREGMVLANNVIYSRDKEALHFANGRAGITFAGNIIFDAGRKLGGVPGRGLEDFTNLSWDTTAANAKPTATAPFDHADPRYLLETDYHGAKRTSPTSGAISR
ncbi:right-handed parallel beta-helix repeat-containing protein [Caulifigura coniformis]|nr:right-handed parallel beta-helix repeat-containing protein [Caulifigura coniformis]